MNMPHLRIDNLFGTELAHHRLELRSTDIVLERAQIEFASRTVEDADTKCLSSILALSGVLFTDGDAVTRLLVGEELLVNQSAVGVDLVQLAPDDLVLGFVFSWRLLALLVRSETHLGTEGGLRLVDASNLVACEGSALRYKEACVNWPHPLRETWPPRS